MNHIDWIFVILPLLIVFFAGWYTKRYMRSVADFVSGGRVAGRYLLAVARGEMASGAVVFVASFEVIRQSGFTLTWWGWINIPVGLMIAITGFVVYRYRETRAMTLAQFFELRYSKSFRIFTGALGFFAGLINFGIIPAVGARFITQFLGLPGTVEIFGFTIMSYIPVMAVLLSITVYLTISGGLISVMITDCLEGMISQIFYLVIIFTLVWLFPWELISSVLTDQPPGQSLINPFDAGGLKDFNIFYVLMGAFVSVYGTMAWQNQSAYNAAGLTPHENRMGNILGRWRDSARATTVLLLGICALTYMKHPHFAPQAAHVNEIVSRIPDPQMQQQMLLPTAVTEFLPTGVKGMLFVILLMGVFGGDSTHLHSWSGLFIQDILVPLRKKPFGPKAHLLLLRCSVLGVALFAFVFGALFRQMEYIIMWWSVTMAVYVGGAGAVIIGGLYWKKGTTAGAWTALLTGSGLALGGIIARQIWGEQFPMNGMQVSFASSLIACVLYLVVSLLTCKQDFNMDRLLHRGEYAKIKKQVGDAHQLPGRDHRKTSLLGRMIGFDENFTLGDKWITGGLFGWSMLWFGIFIVGTLWNLIAPWPNSVWSTFWHVQAISIPIFMAVATSIWFTWGGTRDIRDLLRRLKGETINHLDDGTVVGHQNLDERTKTE
ncbi:MAG: sodium:proline symporter [Chthoniobacterales bacterium]|nr:sodium:proline symporter [Chthoniobacterales bacterium]